MKYPQLDSIEWLLLQIKERIDNMEYKRAMMPSRVSAVYSSRQDIFRGSYDIWKSEEDGYRYMEIMINRINEARNLGLITNNSDEKEWKHNDNWYLTELGRKRLEEYNEKNICD